MYIMYINQVLNKVTYFPVASIIGSFGSIIDEHTTTEYIYTASMANAYIMRAASRQYRHDYTNSQLWSV